jgi:MraZ protein
MFHGEYSYSLDDKGRVIVPKVHREAFADGVYMTRGLERCVWVFPLSTWRELSNRMNHDGLGSSAARGVDRLLYTGTEQQLDKQGRVSIPDYLREHARLTVSEPAAVLGVKNRLELWSPARWRSHSAQMMSRLDDDLARLGL